MIRSQYKQREAHSLLNRDVTPSVRATIYGADGNSDTYITNREALKPVTIYEVIGSKFINLPDENGEIAVLPCDARHNFHKECISSWMEYHVACPLCKTEIK